jgi:twinkle protein
MAVYEATGLPSISLPNGASSLPPELIKWLDHIGKIYLWVRIHTVSTHA